MYQNKNSIDLFSDGGLSYARVRARNSPDTTITLSVNGTTETVYDKDTIFTKVNNVASQTNYPDSIKFWSHFIANGNIIKFPNLSNVTTSNVEWF